MSRPSLQWPSAATLDFELAGRRYLQRRVPWCSLRFKWSAELQAWSFWVMPPWEPEEAMNKGSRFEDQL